MKSTFIRWAVGLTFALGTLALVSRAGVETPTPATEDHAATGPASAPIEHASHSVGHPTKDPVARARELIRDYRTIALTPEQEAIKNEALSDIPAPCCKKFSIATCCCPCNLAKSVWGLAHRLIAVDGQGVEAVRAAAQDYIRETNPSGYAGDACHQGRCGQSFDHDGCGGMNEDHVV